MPIPPAGLPIPPLPSVGRSCAKRNRASCLAHRLHRGSSRHPLVVDGVGGRCRKPCLEPWRICPHRHRHGGDHAHLWRAGQREERTWISHHVVDEHLEVHSRGGQSQRRQRRHEHRDGLALRRTNRQVGTCSRQTGLCQRRVHQRRRDPADHRRATTGHRAQPLDAQSRAGLSHGCLHRQPANHRHATQCRP